MYVSIHKMRYRSMIHFYRLDYSKENSNGIPNKSQEIAFSILSSFCILICPVGDNWLSIATYALLIADTCYNLNIYTRDYPRITEENPKRFFGEKTKL